MNISNFLCVDDQQDSSPERLLRILESFGSISITRERPYEMGEQIKRIFDANESLPNFGLLLDLRLDQEVGADGARVPFRGPSLAQELRTRMAESPDSPAFPIVLWSIDWKFAMSFSKDDTAHDLFDAVYGKDLELNQEPERVSREMRSLALGYSRINQAATEKVLTPQILGLNLDQLAGTAAAFTDYFELICTSRAKHEVALHLLGDLIKPAGLLVAEDMLAARLGVNIASSGENWDALKNILTHAAYAGPFCDGWCRWWWFEIENWWNSLPHRPGNLRRLEASDRIRFLNSTFNLDLIAEIATEGTSTRFFTICVATGKAIDPAEAFRVASPLAKSWHDTVYVSVSAALNRVAVNKWRIDPLDLDRFLDIKSRMART